MDILFYKIQTNALSKAYSAAELNDKLKSVQDLVGSADPTKLADTMTKVSKAAALSPKINMAIFGGIIAGVVAGLLYNKFHKIKLTRMVRFLCWKTFRTDRYFGCNASFRISIRSNLANNSKWY